jgi:DNA repair exonuclease SbcCD ATPase subunit
VEKEKDHKEHISTKENPFGDEKSKLEQKLASLGKEHSSELGSLQEKLQKLESLKQSLEELNKAKSDLEVELDDLAVEYEAKEYEVLSKEFKSKQSEFEKASKGLKSALEDKLNLEKTSQEQVFKLNELEKKVEEITKELGAEKSEAEKKSSSIKSLEKKLESQKLSHKDQLGEGNIHIEERYGKLSSGF